MPPSPLGTCEDYQEIISAWLDDEAHAGDAAAVQRHLDGCRRCRQWLDAAAATTRQVRLHQVPAAATSEALLETILRAIRTARPPEPPARHPSP